MAVLKTKHLEIERGLYCGTDCERANIKRMHFVLEPCMTPFCRKVNVETYVYPTNCRILLLQELLLIIVPWYLIECCCDCLLEFSGGGGLLEIGLSSCPLRTLYY